MNITPNHLRTIDPDEYVPPADENARKAWDELVAIGCPVLGPALEWGGVFAISAECNGDATHGGIYWADYWNAPRMERYEDPNDKSSKILNAFGIDQRIHDVLDKYRFYCEWVNPGVVCVVKG